MISARTSLFGAFVASISLVGCDSGRGGSGGSATTSSTHATGSTSSATGNTTSTGTSTGSSSGSMGSGSTSTGGFDPAHAPSTLGGETVGSMGCAVTGAVTGDQTLSATIDGTSRSAIAFVPPDYDPEKAYPIVFVFHGDGGTGAGIRGALNLEPSAAGKAIFVYPDGLNKTWDDAQTGTNADMDWVLATRDSLRASHCIDTKRTFLTGMSRGGFFVNQLACRYGVAEFAAIAPHSSTIDPGMNGAYIYGPPNPQGGPYTENGDYDFACVSDGTPPPADKPLLPPAAMVIHGECDTEGGVEYAQGRRVAAHWAFAAGATSTPLVEAAMPNPSCGAGPLTSNPPLNNDPCYAAPGAAAGHEVEFCAIPSMGHQVWAGAAAKIWGFFAAH